MAPPPATSIDSYAPGTRLGAALLSGIARANLLVVLAALLRGPNPPITLPALVDVLVVLSLLPALAVRLLARAHRGEAVVGGDRLALRRGASGLEVPLASIAALRPWRVPLPKPGLRIVLASGRRLPWSLATDDPSVLLRALVAAGVGPAADALARPAVIYARSRAESPRRFWKRPVFACALFALLPAGVGFYADQHITYGGLLGEYYLLGLGAYLRSAAATWLWAALLLLLYGTAWRMLVETACLVGAVWTPARAALVRRLAEGGAAALYYASVPALLALRFLS